MSKRNSWIAAAVTIVIAALILFLFAWKTNSVTPDRGTSKTDDAGELRELPLDDVVYSRNLGRLQGEYDVLPAEFRLGTAQVRHPPPWWRELARENGLEPQSKTFPLVFVGRWTPEEGADRLVVLQMRHRFNGDGDGFSGPGPAMWLATHVFERTQSGKWSLIWSDQNALNLHSMQNARLLTGRWKQPPSTIALRIDQRDAQGVMQVTNVTATISGNAKVTFSPASNY